METRKLGRKGRDVTVLGLGTWGLAEQAYGPSTMTELEATIDAAFEVGVRVFDTAPLWADGQAEATLGRVLGKRRGECTVMTRAGVLREDGVPMRRYDADSLRRSVDLSLERLETTYIDVLLLHDPPEKLLFDGQALKLLANLRAEKIISSYGISVSTLAQARFAITLGAQVIVAPHHMLASDIVSELSEQIQDLGACVIARSPLFHGLLADRNRLRYEKDDHRSERFAKEILGIRQRHAAVLEGVVGGDVPSLGAAALRFALSDPCVACALVGARTPEQIREAAAWLEGGTTLPPEKLERIPQLLANVGA